MRAAFAILVGVAACAPRVATPKAVPAGDELTLYRDRAVIKQRVQVAVANAARSVVTVSVPPGVRVEDVVVLDRGQLTISELRGSSAGMATPAADEPDQQDEETGEDEPAPDREPLPELAGPESSTPTELTLVVTAPHAGTFPVHLGYVTDRVSWDAAYTMTTTPARDRVTLRGAIAIRNATGIAFQAARVYVVDADLGPWRGRIAEQLGSAIAGTVSSTTPIPIPRALGRLDLGPGETRVELLPGDPPRSMRSVLVYDPIGTKLDHGGARPTDDANLGVDTKTTASRVTESFEIERKVASSEGLPGGAVRLVEKRPDGNLALLAEARLFDGATRVAETDTVPIGVADGVTGHRERREMTVDTDGKRLVEEFVLTIANTRARPVEVVLREHLYRGQNWTLAYSTAREAAKDGSQQISLRTTVPARSETKVLYVVVYTWP
jgi:hypothetical protein